LTVNLRLENYGDSCGPSEDGSCSSEVYVTTTQVDTKTPEVTCTQSDKICTITWASKNCVINTGAYIEYNMQQQNSYSNRIVANVTSTSSIPGETSSVEQSISSEYNAMYRGSAFNLMYFELIPSVSSRQVFITDSGEWTTDRTGYHVAVNKAAVEGSTVSVYK
jgi:hypothetical protein